MTSPQPTDRASSIVARELDRREPAVIGCGVLLVGLGVDREEQSDRHGVEPGLGQDARDGVG